MICTKIAEQINRRRQLEINYCCIAKFQTDFVIAFNRSQVQRLVLPLFAPFSLIHFNAPSTECFPPRNVTSVSFLG